jgi:hypothetical protein
MALALTLYVTVPRIVHHSHQTVTERGQLVFTDWFLNYSKGHAEFTLSPPIDGSGFVLWDLNSEYPRVIRNFNEFGIIDTKMNLSINLHHKEYMLLRENRTPLLINGSHIFVRMDS